MRVKTVSDKERVLKGRVNFLSPTIPPPSPPLMVDGSKSSVFGTFTETKKGKEGRGGDSVICTVKMDIL